MEAKLFGAQLKQKQCLIKTEVLISAQTPTLPAAAHSIQLILMPTSAFILHTYINK